MVNQPIAIRKFEKECNGHCRISPFIDGGIIGEMGSIRSRTRARARATVGGREATLHAALNFGGESNWQASVR
jgi:hypothetical protein